jgi:carbonic anhydrase
MAHDAQSLHSRRALIAKGSALAATLLLPPVPAAPRNLPMNLLDTLSERNQAFALTRFSSSLKIVPSLKLLIIGCVDPRVDPTELFGLHPGEAAVIRNVGGRVYPSTLQTMDMLVEVARAAGGNIGAGWSLMVLHHTDCGINSLVHSPQMLADHFAIPAGQVPSMAITDPDASVVIDVAALKADPRLAGAAVSGLVYDVHTGRVKTVVGAS